MAERRNHPTTMTWETWRKLGSAKQRAYQATCPHSNVEVLEEWNLPRCLDCTAMGPWPGHPSHGHFPNGQPA